MGGVVKGIRDGRGEGWVLGKSETIEGLESGGRGVETSVRLGLAVGRVEISKKAGESTAGYNGVEQVLFIALTSEEKEKLVLDDRAADAAAELVSLEVIGGVAGKRSIQTLVAEIVTP